MAMSTFQKVTLATCLVLCVALLLPKMLLSRGRRDAAERPEGSGNFPPMMHRQVAPEGRGQRAAGSGFSRAQNPEAIARAKGPGTGTGAGGKSNLAGQIIPVYGFGILLYILYILFKITSKGSSKPPEGRFPPVRTENMKRKITDYELAQLQEKLRETELVMESIVSSAHHSPDRVKGVTADQEESLLQQLTEITRVMQEGQMMEGIAPEKKIQEDWDAFADYPDEPQPYWEHSHCCCQHSPTEGADIERTEEDKDSSSGNLPEDITCSGEADGAEDLSTDSVKKPVFTATRDEDMIPERDVEVREEEDLHEHEEGGGHIDMGAQEEDLVGVLKELELTLKMASVLEQEKIMDHFQPAETESSCSSVRRRNKRRRAKKAVH
ncbi:protein RIC-3b [Melanotaenia boesemani]|uniref:protein RIC-3b n=1 Tax=Melanotaenia boesemani TaxID=1250792 RepID=UPI001C059289|nr:protein RIC-3b [Melanotaenia boesemani]